MASRTPRSCRWWSLLAISAVIGALGCGAGNYGVHSRYESPDPPPEPGPTSELMSAHLSRYALVAPDGPDTPETPLPSERMAELSEREQASVLLVFADELDPLTLSPLAFAVLRADGRRVRPTAAFLAPADENDENRSVTLIGKFGGEGQAPIAVHVITPLYTEAGIDLRGLDADITPDTEPDRPVLVERLVPNETRCPGATQLLRSYWSDALTQVGPDDLAGVELELGDGRVVHPVDFDDQAAREDDPPCPGLAACLGPADDNVLDLCLDFAEPVVRVRFTAGLFADASGHPSAAADVALPSP